ncbi:MAG: hypothetical protein RLZ63_1501 [Pseudomonadota bacterium]|jgi:hypothetical protein
MHDFSWRKALVWLGIVLTLLLVSLLYLRPDFVISMADQLWACF